MSAGPQCFSVCRDRGYPGRGTIAWRLEGCPVWGKSFCAVGLVRCHCESTWLMARGVHSPGQVLHLAVGPPCQRGLGQKQEDHAVQGSTGVC